MLLRADFLSVCRRGDAVESDVGCCSHSVPYAASLTTGVFPWSLLGLVLIWL